MQSRGSDYVKEYAIMKGGMPGREAKMEETTRNDRKKLVYARFKNFLKLNFFRFSGDCEPPAAGLSRGSKHAHRRGDLLPLDLCCSQALPIPAAASGRTHRCFRRQGCPTGAEAGFPGVLTYLSAHSLLQAEPCFGGVGGGSGVLAGALFPALFFFHGLSGL